MVSEEQAKFEMCGDVLLQIPGFRVQPFNDYAPSGPDPVGPHENVFAFQDIGGQSQGRLVGMVSTWPLVSSCDLHVVLGRGIQQGKTWLLVPCHPATMESHWHYREETIAGPSVVA